MRVPFLTNRVGDMIIHALRAGGYLADDWSAEQIQSVDNDISEADMINRAVGLNYGSAGTGAGSLASTEDVYIFVDSDNTNPTTPYTNYLKVVKGQDTVPVVDPYRDMFALGASSGPDQPWVYCRIGPHPVLLNPGDIFKTELYLGTEHLGATPNHLLKLSGGDPVSSSSQIRSTYTLSIESGGKLSLSSRDAMYLSPSNLSSTYGLALYASATDNSFSVDFNDSVTEHSLILRSRLSGFQTRFCVGGQSGVQHYDPGNLLIGAGYPSNYTSPYCQPTFHMSSAHLLAPNEDRRCVLSTWHRGENTTVTDGTHLVNFHSQLDFGTLTTNKIRLFSVTGFNLANREVAFEVRSDRSCYTGGVWTTTGLDLAEIFQSTIPSTEIEAGTVMSVTSTGKVVASPIDADTNVVGVVSTKPGVTLGDRLSEEETSAEAVPIAMSGTVPVRCTTSGGAIEVGNLLVSAGGGRARKVSKEDPQGSIIGKALAALPQSGGDIVNGTIKMLVLNS